MHIYLNGGDGTALEECFTMQKLPQQLLNNYSEENVCSVHDPNDFVMKFNEEDQPKLSIFVKHSPFIF